MKDPTFLRLVTQDHLIPSKKGGSGTLQNRFLACHWCNAEKKDQVLGETEIDKIGHVDIIATRYSNDWIEVVAGLIVVKRNKEREYAELIYDRHLKSALETFTGEARFWTESPSTLPAFTHRNVK